MMDGVFLSSTCCCQDGRLARTEKMPEQKSRSGMSQRYLLIKMRSAAATVAVSETEPSKLTEMSALKDNASDTARSSNSRVICNRFTTCLLVFQRLSSYLAVRFEPRVFLPLLIGADHFGASASSFRSISKKVIRFPHDTVSLKREAASCCAFLPVSLLLTEKLLRLCLKTRGNQ